MKTMTCNRNEPQPEAAQSRGPAWRRIARLVLAACVLFATQPGGLEPAPARAESPNGAILYSTYLGGSAIGGEAAYGIAVDPQRRAIVVGFTTSDDFPKLNALFPLKKGFEDGFVTKIDPSKSGAASLV